MVTGKESNSQSNITLASGFMDQLFDSEATARYTLFIFVGPQEIAGLVCDESNRPLAGEHYTQVELFEEGALKKLFSHSDVFNHLFKHVHVYTSFSNEITTPIDWIESNEDENMLRHACGNQEDFFIHTFIDSRYKWIFGLPKTLNKLIKNTYKHVSVTPLLASKSNIMTADLCIITSDNTLTLFDNEENNAWKNCLPFDNAQSALFAALSYTEINNIASETVSIDIIGNDNTTKQLIALLQPYFKVVQSINSTNSTAQEFDSCLLHLLQKLSYAHH
jgi:hypothetical protein